MTDQADQIDHAILVTEARARELAELAETERSEEPVNTGSQPPQAVSIEDVFQPHLIHEHRCLVAPSWSAGGIMLVPTKAALAAALDPTGQVPRATVQLIVCTCGVVRGIPIGQDAITPEAFG